jgi:hypothetical protein
MGVKRGLLRWKKDRDRKYPKTTYWEEDTPRTQKAQQKKLRKEDIRNL